jgi:hypothetical protein
LTKEDIKVTSIPDEPGAICLFGLLTFYKGFTKFFALIIAAFYPILVCCVLFGVAPIINLPSGLLSIAARFLDFGDKSRF